MQAGWKTLPIACTALPLAACDADERPQPRACVRPRTGEAF